MVNRKKNDKSKHREEAETPSQPMGWRVPRCRHGYPSVKPALLAAEPGLLRKLPDPWLTFLPFLAPPGLRSDWGRVRRHGDVTTQNPCHLSGTAGRRRFDTRALNNASNLGFHELTRLSQRLAQEGRRMKNLFSTGQR